MTRQQQALAYFVRMGWTPAQSAGIVANLIAESSLDPAAVGDGGRAFGVAQWHPDRQENFRAIIGRDIRGSSFEDQLAFVHAELNGTEKAAGDALRACTTAAEAAACVSIRYERPADRDGEAVKRVRLAEKLLATAQNDAGATISPPDISTPQPSEKKPMLPLLLPAVLQMIPQLIGIFGKGGERAAQNAQAAQAVADAITTATNSVNLQAGIEKMAANPEAKAAATAAVLQTPAVAALLETITPVMDKLAAYDKADREAAIAGRNAAMLRQQADAAGIVPIVVRNVNGQSWMVLGGLVVALIGCAVAKGYWSDMPDYFTVVLALAGPLFGQVMKERGAIIAYYFDGTVTSNATAVAREIIAKATPDADPKA